MSTNFAKGSSYMFDGALNAPINVVFSNLIKDVVAEAIMKNGNFHSVKYLSY